MLYINICMAYNYRGEEILSELIINKGVRGKGKIKQKQKIIVKCFNCKQIKEVGYDIHVSNRLKSKKSNYHCRSCIAKETITSYNKSMIGVSLEDRLGKEKADLLKENSRKFAIDNKIGSRLQHFPGLSWEDRFGEERAKIKKEKCRRDCKFVPKFGKDNPQFGKPAHKLSGSGCKGYYNGIFFRSLLEASYIINVLYKNNIKFESGELKKYAIPYKFNGRERNYFCDFITDNIFIEIKPKALHFNLQNLAKWNAAKIWCEERGLKHMVYSELDFPKLAQDTIDFLILTDKLILL